MTNPVPVSDYRHAARRKLPRFLFDYIEGGALEEQTLAANVADLQRLSLRQRVLRDVAAVSTQADLLGEPCSLPLVLAPVGLAGMNARRGETQAARAAEAAGVPFCLSTVSVCPLAEVRRSVSKPVWFQLYMMKDRGFVRALLDQAVEAGTRTLLFTVDMPVPGTRYRDYRSGLAGASGLAGSLRRLVQGASHPGWAWDVGARGRPHTLGNISAALGGRESLQDFFAWMRTNFDPSITWRDLEWVREAWPGKLVLKGILDPADAERAADLKADGIVISNHGGRQLDGAPSTARALRPIAERVGARLTVLADGGVRSGSDIVRMMALGAAGVMIGRAWAYALAAGGEGAVRTLIETLRAEMQVTMSLAGMARPSDIGGDMLFEDGL